MDHTTAGPGQKSEDQSQKADPQVNGIPLTNLEYMYVVIGAVCTVCIIAVVIACLINQKVMKRCVSGTRQANLNVHHNSSNNLPVPQCDPYLTTSLEHVTDNNEEFFNCTLYKNASDGNLTQVPRTTVYLPSFKTNYSVRLGETVESSNTEYPSAESNSTNKHMLCRNQYCGYSKEMPYLTCECFECNYELTNWERFQFLTI